MRNWKRMSLLLAPIALRMPISRVRSRTETSMMFMIPIPPTTSEIEAIPARSTVSRPVIEPTVVSSWAWSNTLKSAVSVGPRPWRALSVGRDLGLDRVHLVGRGDADADRADRVARDEVIADRVERHEDLVVLVERSGATLRLEDADHPERDPADRDVGPDGARRPSPRSVAVVAPSTATRMARSFDGPVRNEPCQIALLWTVAYWGRSSRRSTSSCSGRPRRRASGWSARARPRRSPGSGRPPRRRRS